MFCFFFWKGNFWIHMFQIGQFLVGGWTNPSEKYAQVKLDHFLRYRGKNKKFVRNHHLGFHWISVQTVVFPTAFSTFRSGPPVGEASRMLSLHPSPNHLAPVRALGLRPGNFKAFFWENPSNVGGFNPYKCLKHQLNSQIWVISHVFFWNKSSGWWLNQHPFEKYAH